MRYITLKRDWVKCVEQISELYIGTWSTEEGRVTEWVTGTFRRQLWDIDRPLDGWLQNSGLSSSHNIQHEHPTTAGSTNAACYVPSIIKGANWRWLLQLFTSPPNCLFLPTGHGCTARGDVMQRHTRKAEKHNRVAQVQNHPSENRHSLSDFMLEPV